MKKELQSNVNGMTSGGGSIQHPFSIHSASIGSRWKLGGIQVLLTLVILFTFSVGQMWGTCDPGTIFKFEVKDGLTNGNIAAGNPVNLSSYVTVTAGTVSAYGQNAGSLAIVDEKAISIAKKAEAYFIFTLSEGCSLQEGDVIKYIIYNKNALLQPETTTSDAADKLTLTKTSNVTTYGSVVIPAGHALIGESTFYLFTGDNACKIKSVEISRPATITLDATTNGGSVSTTSLKGVIGDKVGLPHAFKTGKKFKGWYTTADGDVKKNDAYTIAGDITLYAQFEDLPVSGEMFSLTMEDDLKPLEQCTIVSTVSKSTHLLSPVELTRYATIYGGSAVLSNSSTSNHAYISNSTASAILNGGNGCLTITLESALQVGDVITTSIASQNIAYTVEATRSTATNFVKGNDQTLTVTSESPLKGKSVIYLWSGSSSGGALKSITITRPTPHTLSYAVSPMGKGTVTLGATSLVEGAQTTATYSAIDGAYEFDEWQISGTGATLSSTSTNPTTITMGSTDATVTLKLKEAVTKYTITYSKGANGTGTAIPNGKKDEGVDFTLSDATYDRDGYVQTGWATEDGGAKAYDLGGTYSTDADEELFPFWTPVYTVTKGTHEHGDFTISPASLVAGGTVTLDPTPADGYMFSAWEVVKTSDASATGITVTNKQFEMPAYGVTVNATFVTDTRKKVLYLTSNTAEATASNDKLYAALKDDYKVTIAAPDAQTLANYDLVVLHESINGKAAAPDDATNRKQAVLDAKTTSVPVLNTKTYFYNSGRWGWGSPNNGQAAQKVATLNSGYCNVADHPIFAGVTITAGTVTVLTNDATGNTMQPVAPSSGKEGYLLATTPNASSGVGYAIQEIPAGGFRGASSGKYILISVSNAGLNNLTTDGQKLFKNAADYLTSATPWNPISVPTSPEVTATPSENYTEGNTITLTASATGTSASTTYTWYKGDNWAAASATTPVQAASTSGATFSKTAAVEDAGTYWCNISNGTSCDAQASVTITVSSASTPTHTISYDNVKGADMTAYPTEYTEGIGVASFDPLADITGWHFVEWSPASIATDATTDQTITAVWAQVFEVTFNLQGHGASIDAQNIVDGGKVTKPDDPVAIGFDFGGWFTDEECTVGNEFDFENTTITADRPLYAKWTAFGGCTLLVPATSGDAPAVGDPISMQSGSKGGSMSVIGTPLSYNTYGLGFDSNSSAKAKVTINNEIQEGTVISLTLVANGTSSPRGLHLYTGDGATKITSLGWTSDVVKYTEETYTYTVQSTDVALIGTNEFQLWRNSSVFLKQLTVTNCGDPVIFHNLTSAITPDHDPAYATVTLGASSVREGYTTTATYSAIDAAYEFDEWQISGTGASIADASANPAVITMGTADAVVTLKLKVATPKHTVTFNKMGKGADIASQLVAEGAKVTEPTVTEPEGWMLEGWYKESTLENKWDFATDVMGNTNIELFANWVADTSIKLFSNTGVLNTTNFVSAAASTIEIDAVEHVCLAQFASNRSSLAGTVPADMVQYNATTNAAKIQITFYNTNSSAKRAYLYRVKEGDTEATPLEISVPGQEIWTTEYYTFNGEENRSFYVTAGDRSNIRILQVRVVDNGTAIKQAGQAGYSLNFNKGRLYVKNGVETSFEGMTINASSEYKVFNNSNIATNSNFSFTTTVDKMVLKVTRSGGNYYVSQDPASKGTIYNNNQEIVLTPAGTWYIGSETSGSAASFTKIEFIAPKCAEPAFNSLANSDICSGDPYVALNGTATVADAGVPTYKWYAEGADESDPAAVLGTGATYTPEADGNYYVIATNHLAGYTDNTKKSDLVTVTTHAGTTITGYTNANGAAGATGKQISVTAEGVGTLHYVWYTCDDELGSNPVALPENDAATLSGITIPSGIQYYKVVVTSTCGSAEQILFAKEWVDVELQDVTGSMIWNWHKTQNPDAWTGIDGDITVASTSVLANVNYGQIPNVTNFHSAMLKVVVSTVETKIRKGTDNGVIQGNEIMFHTTVPGIVIVTYRGTGNSANVTLTIGSETLPTYAGSMTTSKKVFVPAGDVVISSGSDAFRIQMIQFIAEADYTRNITEGRYGTICLPKAGVMVGADIYEVAYYGATSKKIFFDEILGGVMEAGVPYIFLPKEGVSTLGVFYTSDDVVPAGTYYTDGTTPASTSKNGLIGFIGANENAETAVPDGEGNYILQNNQYREVLAGADARIKSYRAYINLGAITPTAPALAPGRRRISMGVASENSATGMDELNATETPVKMMIDGQLFILRGEKLYDATGRLVK